MKLKEVIVQELENMKDENSKITKEEFDELVRLLEEAYRVEMRTFGDPLNEVIENIQNGDIEEMAGAGDEDLLDLYHKLLGWDEEED